MCICLSVIERRVSLDNGLGGIHNRCLGFEHRAPRIEKVGKVEVEGMLGGMKGKVMLRDLFLFFYSPQLNISLSPALIHSPLFFCL